tara:strand:- start:2610 stop:2774 length:165 start_codon:yes stop_codon:yes gene_type:complete
MVPDLVVIFFIFGFGYLLGLMTLVILVMISVNRGTTFVIGERKEGYYDIDCIKK